MESKRIAILSRRELVAEIATWTWDDVEFLQSALEGEPDD